MSFFSTSIVGFTILEGLIDTIWASRSLTVAAYKTVLPELHKASFLTVCQADFNLNSKLSRKTLSFYRYLYINARLVVHQGQPIHFQIFQIGDNMLRIYLRSDWEVRGKSLDGSGGILRSLQLKVGRKKYPSATNKLRDRS